MGKIAIHYRCGRILFDDPLSIVVFFTSQNNDLYSIEKRSLVKKSDVEFQIT